DAAQRRTHHRLAREPLPAICARRTFVGERRRSEEQNGKDGQSQKDDRAHGPRLSKPHAIGQTQEIPRKPRFRLRARLCHAVYAARGMSHTPWVRLSSALPLLALLACKLGKDDEQSARTLPTAEPASTTPPSRPVEAEQPQRPKETAPHPTSAST